MKIPDKCPKCGVSWNGTDVPPLAYLIERASLDWDADKPDYVGDTISECSRCHTLFRLRWKLDSFRQLREMSVGYHDVEKFYREEADVE